MKTYKLNNSLIKGFRVVEHLADQKEPVPAPEIANALNMQYGTLMCHLTTLEHLGIARQIGEHWELGTKIALYWARKKAELQSERDRIDRLIHAMGA